MSKFVQQNDTEERAIFQRRPNWIVIPVRESSDFKGSDNEPGEMQIHTYSCQTEYWQRAFHGHRWARRLNINNRCAALPRSRLFVGFGPLVLGADPQAHWNHRRVSKSVLAEKRLRDIFRAIGQQRDSEKVFLLRKIDGVFQKLVAVALALILRVDHQVL